MNTSPPPCIEWHVETECKRNFCWSAPDKDSLVRDMKRRSYTPIMDSIMPQHEWEAEQDWEQKKLTAEIHHHIEKEWKAS